ncbi:Variable outer membrane protein (plasmid) [Borrelia parkeri SLO]|uniref:Variable large protein n=1 Tax=Borrelia parkeri SLO TaxID=1313294 RepID=W5STD6_BORPR|nr:Variable outer membrane protein [Borrelia parkeri SLO]
MQGYSIYAFSFFYFVRSLLTILPLEVIRRHVIMKRITFCALLMTLFLLLSCGSGSSKTEDPKTIFLTSIANLGKGFLDVFTSLSDMITGAFGINADTKKSDIGKYFTDIETTMNTVKKSYKRKLLRMVTIQR